MIVREISFEGCSDYALAEAHKAWIRSANSISVRGDGKLKVPFRRTQGSSSCLTFEGERLILVNDPFGI